MPARCSRCQTPADGRARFCNRCGTTLRTEELARHCEQCSARIAVGASFCNQCGHRVGAPVEAVPVEPAAPEPVELVSSAVEIGPLEEVAVDAGEDTRSPEWELPGRELPPRRLPRQRAEGEPARAAGWPMGSLIADLGALVALIGCFLPLAQSMGESVSLVPSVAEEFSYAYIVPASAIIIALVAWAGTVGSTKSRVSNGGAVIAVSSPWTVLFVLVILGATRALGYLGPLSFGTDIGIGLIALAVGFGMALIGGFMILQNAVEE